MRRRVLYVWLPNWPCQRALQNDPNLVGQAFALQVREARRGLIIVAANLLARQQGIYPGMSVSEAMALGRATSLIVLDHDSHEDIETLCWIADAAQRFSPIVGLESLDKKIWASRSIHQPQGIVCEATNLGPVFGGESAMARQVQSWLQNQGYVSAVAIADSIGAAWALANFALRTQIAEALLQQQQAGLPPAVEPIAVEPIVVEPIVVEPGNGRAALLELPVECLRIEPSVAKSLHRLGIRTIDALLQLPRHGLASRLGTELIDRLDQAWAASPEPIVARQTDPDMEVTMGLEYPTNHLATIEELVRRLSTQLCQRLTDRGRGALRLVCRFDLVESPSIVLQLGLFRASAEVEHLTPLLLGQLDQQWSEQSGKPREIHRLTIQATATGPLSWQQPDLFEVEQVIHRNAIARLIDGLSSRLGRRAVVSPQVHRDPQPELACSWRPLTGLRNDGQNQDTSRKLARKTPVVKVEPTTQDPLRRPLNLLQPPKSIDARMHHHLDQVEQINWNRRWYRVVRAWGPERIESGWWRGPSHRRDYYRIELDSGDWLWIFRQLHSNEWFLHGEFV